MLETEFIPAKDPSRRLLVALHGLGDSIAGYQWLAPALGLPWMNILLVNAPDRYYGGYSWYDFTGDQNTGIERSRRLLFELLDARRAEGFLTEDTVLFGFSQGCLMTVEVGFRYPHRFAGMVGVSGYVHKPEKLIQESSPASREQRMLFTHGRLDPIVPFVAVRGQVSLLTDAGFRIDWREFNKAHTIAGDEELDVIRDFIRGCYEPS